MKHLQMRLETESIKKAIEELKDYKDSLITKNELFINKLLDEGIKVAESYKGFYGGYIVFEKEIEPGKSQCAGMLIGRNTKEITSYWNRYGQIVHADISPILFAEFGSGWLSEVLFNVSGVGQGTFPGQTHAFDKGGWWYKGINGVWYHNGGFKPSHPMYHAEMEMLDQVYSIAREVFYGGI